MTGRRWRLDRSILDILRLKSAQVGFASLGSTREFADQSFRGSRFVRWAWMASLHGTRSLTMRVAMYDLIGLSARSWSGGARDGRYCRTVLAYALHERLAL
jgi:hypothetical protein